MTALALRHDSDLSRYMTEIGQFPLLDRDEERALAIRFKEEGDVHAAHQLVTSNLRFVVRVAMEYKGYGLRMLDLIQEGNIGLMQAVKKFDPDRGYRLITYAVWWIRAQIQSFIMNSWSLVKLGAGRVKRKLFFKLRSTKSRAEQDAWGDVSTEEVAERLGVPQDEVSEMEVRMAARDFSLDAPVDGGTNTSFLGLQGEEANQEQLLHESEAKALLSEAIDKTKQSLNDKERYILENRMLSDEPPTMSEIGAELGVSRQRVQQIEARLLDKIRSALPNVAPHRRLAQVSP